MIRFSGRQGEGSHPFCEGVYNSEDLFHSCRCLGARRHRINPDHVPWAGGLYERFCNMLLAFPVQDSPTWYSWQKKQALAFGGLANLKLPGQGLNFIFSQYYIRNFFVSPISMKDDSYHWGLLEFQIPPWSFLYLSTSSGTLS